MKRELLDAISPVIVTPSKWLAEEAKKSSLMQNLRIEVIPNSIDIDVYKPIEKRAARIQLGLNPDGFYLLFGAESANEKRKGYFELIEAIKLCLNDNKFKTMVENGKMALLSFGAPNELVNQIGLPITNIDYVESEKKLTLLYNAADFYILPSLEDNLPNTILESFGCGTPVIAFNTGGIPEIIEHNVTGFLARAGDIHDLSHLIIEAMNLSSSDAREFGRKSRDKAVTDYSLPIQAKRYGNLYYELLGIQIQKKLDSNRIDTLPKNYFLEFEKYPKLDRLYYEAMVRFIERREKDYVESEADRTARLEVIQKQGLQLSDLETRRNDLQIRLEGVLQQLEASEKDRADRLNVINNQGQRLGELEAERNDLQNQLRDVIRQFEASEKDRADRLNVINNQGQRLGELEAERDDLRNQLRDVIRQFEASETDCADRLNVIQEQGRRLGELEAELNALQNQLNDAIQKNELNETDRAAKLVVIEQQARQISGLQAELNKALDKFINFSSLWKKLKRK